MISDPPNHSSKSSEPQIRVVDRRWWARTDSAAGVEDTSTRKPTYVEELERQLAEKAQQLQTYITEHRRSLDEFEQAKVRIRRDATREVERARRAVLVELLEVVDNLDRAIAGAREGTAATDRHALVRGVELVRDQFLAKLETFGITRVASLAQRFDATRHEAIGMMRVDDPSRDGVVVAVVKEGYAIGDEVLRPASVVIGQH